jgi:hypothetical protein
VRGYGYDSTDKSQFDSHPPENGSAVTHGGFSNLKVLPGEDFEEFKELVKALRDEFKPSGAL